MNAVLEDEHRHRVLNRLLSHKALNEGERHVIRWQFPDHQPFGGFWTAQWDALTKADPTNLERLARAFPEHVIALEAWRSGDLAKRLVALEPDVESYL